MIAMKSFLLRIDFMLCTPQSARRLRALLEPCPDFQTRIDLLLGAIEYRVVTDAASVAAVQEMRYHAYFREGAAGFRADQRLSDCYDGSPNAATVALCFEGLICASIRLHVVTEDWHDSPAVDAFPAQLKPLIRAGERLIDPNCFCVDPLLSGGVPELARLTLRLCHLVADLRKRTIVTATVRAEHRAFYARYLQCRQIAPPKSYAGRTKPLGLMLCDFDRERGNVLARNPFFAPRPGEIGRVGLDRIGMIDPAVHTEPVAA
jgi:hypothetical protein